MSRTKMGLPTPVSEIGKISPKACSEAQVACSARLTTQTEFKVGQEVSCASAFISLCIPVMNR